MENEENEKESLIERVRAGDDAAFAELCEEYGPLIRSMASSFAHMTDAADEEQAIQDFSQDATLALYRAARTYDTANANGKVTFGLYAKVCIRNALTSVIRRQSKKKKADKSRGKNSRVNSDPTVSRISADAIDIDSLVKGDLFSPFEKKVFAMYAGGMKIRDIAAEVGKSSKSVSNAVYRIKSKLRISLGETEDVK